MKFKIEKNGFLGSDEGINYQSSYEKSAAVVIPYGMESTVSYGSGTKKGPKATIEASWQVETIDEQTYDHIFKCGISTIKEPKVPSNPEKALQLLDKITDQVVSDKKFPVIIGGEHSLSQGAMRAMCKHYKDITILHFDAHADMREHYHGSVYSHGAVMHQTMKNLPVKDIVQVGIRNLSDTHNNEMKFRNANKNKIKTFWAWEKIDPEKIANSIKAKNVYISIDVDVFDPSIMPATGTPEPGGIYWWETLEILKAVFRKRNVVGADLVEFAPIKGLHHADFFMAKLAYKIIGYKFFPKMKNSPKSPRR